MRGLRKTTRDRNGIVIRTEVVQSPKVGRDVVLGLNIALQEQATALLNEIVEGESTPERKRPPGACIVALDVQTGEILAAATAPTFDVNDWLSGAREIREALNADSRNPLISRATQARLPPGSVFKTVSAVALLESGKINPDRAINCAGYLDNPKKYRCYTYTHFGHGHYETDLTKALAVSCNVYFFQAARTLGPQPLVDWAARFGFGKPSGIDLPGEVSGHVPRPPESPPATLAKRGSMKNVTREQTEIELASHEEIVGNDADGLLPTSPWADDAPQGEKKSSSASKKLEPWYSGDTLGLAIGQSRLTVTPLQIARMMAAVGNDGWLVTPHVVREIAAAPETETDAADQTISKRLAAAEPINAARRRIEELSDGTLARVREGLEQVVSDTHGTGYKTVRMKAVQIAGKTGTAENGPGRLDHAWFAGYVPADRPQVAFVVVLEHAGSGGKEAGPVAKKFVQALLDQRVIRAGR